MTDSDKAIVALYDDALRRLDDLQNLKVQRLRPGERYVDFSLLEVETVGEIDRLAEHLGVPKVQFPEPW